MTIADTTVELKQTTRTKFTINGLSSEIGLGDVNVDELVDTVVGADKINYLVKDVVMSDDKKSATVELFYEFNDGGKYEVTVKGYDTETLLASKGEPKKIHLYADKYNMYGYNVLVGTDSPIYYKVYDANGIDVTLGDVYDENISYTIKYTDANYEDSANYISFAEVGDKAIVTATFCSNVTDENGNYTNEFTSAPFTFYGVNKATSLVKSIEAYAVNGRFYNDDKHLIRMENEDDANLQVKILLTDNQYRTITLESFGQLIDDTDGNEIGTAFFTSLNPDVIEVKDADGKVKLEPRKLGNGRIMVSYKTLVNDVEVNTAIGVVSVEVAGKRVMTTASLDNSSVILSSNPAEGSSLHDPEVTLTVKDQYNADYIDYEILDGADDIVAKNDISEDALARNVITVLDVEAYKDFDGDGQWTLTKIGEKIKLDSSVFDEILATTKSTTKTFKFDIKVKDTVNYGTKTLTLTVNAKNPVSNIKDVVEKGADEKMFTTSYKIEMDKTHVDWCGGNVARVWTNDGSTPEITKTASFIVYDIKNTAKYNELALTPLLDKSNAAIQDVATGNYFMVYKDGVNITNKASVDTETLGNGTKVTLDFSVVKPSKIDGTKDIVYYEYNDYNGYHFVGGAGKYEFVFYEIKATTSGNKLYQKQKVTLNTTVDTGKYEFVKRTSVFANAEDDVTLLKCFVVNDRNGKTYGANDVYFNGDGAAVAKIDNVERLFKVNVDDALSNDKSVFVKSITFWESVGVWNADTDTASLAEYTVDVGMFIDIVE